LKSVRPEDMKMIVLPRGIYGSDFWNTSESEQKKKYSYIKKVPEQQSKAP
jgi:hypothetical protein